MTLDTLPPRQRARILAVDWDSLAPDEGKRLRALGIDAGARVLVEHRGIFRPGTIRWRSASGG